MNLLSTASRRLRRPALLGVAGLVLAASLASATARQAPAPRGVIPEGIWVLDQARSVELTPGAQTLWIVKDDGTHLIWVNVFRDAQRRARVTSYEGVYGGDATPVLGTAMTTRISSAGPGRLSNAGEISGMGPYAEECAVTARGKRFICHGKVTTPDGEKGWTDNFRWVSAGPG